CGRWPASVLACRSRAQLPAISETEGREAREGAGRKTPRAGWVISAPGVLCGAHGRSRASPRWAAGAVVLAASARPGVAEDPRPLCDLGQRDHAAADAGGHGGGVLRAVSGALPGCRDAGGGG